jgi:hypothetical protein
VFWVIVQRTLGQATQQRLPCKGFDCPHSADLSSALSLELRTAGEKHLK